MKILYTGFAPFGGETINAAYEAIRLLPGRIEGADVVRLLLPTVFGEGGRVLLSALEKERPDVVICVGEASGRAAVTPEYVAINCRNARIPDNAGQQPFDEKIRPEGPDAYFTKLPIHDIVQRCLEHDIPCSVSYTAGTYVCNDVMYSLLHAIRTDWPEMTGGFIHVPCQPSQAMKKHPVLPSMDVRLASMALRLAGELSIHTVNAK